MTKTEINNLLKKALMGRAISQIDKNQNFILQLNHYPIKKDGFPNLLIFELLSDWHIKEIGLWSKVKESFPTSISKTTISSEPFKAFYIHYLSENSVITNVSFDKTKFLEIEFNMESTIMIPNVNEYDELAWSLRGRNLSISYNCVENICYVETPWD